MEAFFYCRKDGDQYEFSTLMTPADELDQILMNETAYYSLLRWWKTFLNVRNQSIEAAKIAQNSFIEVARTALAKPSITANAIRSL